MAHSLTHGISFNGSDASESRRTAFDRAIMVGAGIMAIGVILVAVCSMPQPFYEPEQMSMVFLAP
jgi:hypothetical protein